MLDEHNEEVYNWAMQLHSLRQERFFLIEDCNIVTITDKQVCAWGEDGTCLAIVDITEKKVHIYVGEPIDIERYFEDAMGQS